jgi:hypothetical protein
MSVRGGLVVADKYAVQDMLGHAPNDAVDVDLVNAPVMFIAPSVHTVASGELWIAPSCHDNNYGGCVIWISNTGDEYREIKTLEGQAVVGVLSADFASAVGTDTIHTLAVDFTGTLPPDLYQGTVLENAHGDDFDRNEPLCYVGGEFLAFKNSALVDVGQYELDYFERGLYGSTPGALAGSPFVLLKDGIFKYKFNQAAVGKTLYFKFQAFNAVGGGLQDLADCVEYSVVLAVDGGVKALLSDVSAATAGKEDVANRVTAWSVTPTHVHYPSEKLVKDTLDLKLDASVYNEHFKGKYPTLIALQAAYPTAAVGDYGQVDIGAGHDVINYNWDAEDGWVIGSSGSGATNTDMLPEGSTNFYHTDYRVQHALLSDFVDPGTTGSVDNTLDVVQAIQNLWGNYVDSLNYFLPSGAATTKYLTGDSFGSAAWVVLSTLRVPEFPGGGQYFTTARVLATVLTGLSLATAAVIAATDTVLGSLGKLQAQITAQKMPAGGTTNQVLSKIDGTAYNTQWVTPAAGGGGATALVITESFSYSNSTELSNTFGASDIQIYNSISGASFTTSTGRIILPAGNYLIYVKGNLANAGKLNSVLTLCDTSGVQLSGGLQAGVTAFNPNLASAIPNMTISATTSVYQLVDYTHYLALSANVTMLVMGGGFNKATGTSFTSSPPSVLNLVITFIKI